MAHVLVHSINIITWTVTVDAIKEKCGKQVTKDNLKDQSGFGWDEDRKMIVVLDDVWEGYVKSHPDAKSYRYKALTNYDDLAIIIGNANAKGGGATTGSELSKARKEQNKTDKTNKRARLPTVDVEKLCQVISKIPDLDQTLMLEAVDLLANNKTKEHVFNGLPDELKKDWLLMHLKQSKN
ncbi:hypothetical protein ACHQM5_020572 [Ranunculus cassubicifolius]